MESNLIFRVVVQEGKGFGNELQALFCSATFGDITRNTPFSVGKDKHTWNTLLQWSTSKQQVRRLSSAGQNTCKVTVTRKDGNKLGWVVLDLRKAKLNNQYSKEEGEWFQLSGGKVGDSAPQLRVFFSLAEELVRSSGTEEVLLSQLDQRLAGEAPTPASAPSGPGPSGAANSPPGPSNTAPSAAAGAAPGATAATMQQQQLSGEASYADDFEDAGGEDATSPPAPRNGAALPAPSPAPAAVASAAVATTAAPAPAARAPAQQQQAPTSTAPAAQSHPSSGTGMGGAGAAAAVPAGALTEGPMREFKLTLDVRSFQAGKRLPLNVANAYIQAMLPPELVEAVVGSGRRLPAKLAPLRSHPAAEVARGAEGGIPNGAASLEFAAGVVGLARLLAKDPRIAVEVWHKERFRADTLLGVASVPLTPLLHDCWVDGYAPVYALLAGQGPQAAPEKIQVGMLRVVISLEDKGPGQILAPSSASSPPAAASAPGRSSPTPRATSPARAPAPMPVFEAVPAAPAANPGPAATAAGAAASAAAAAGGHRHQQEQHQYQQHQSQQQGMSVADLPQGAGVPQVQHLPEYEAAYQLEVWKKAEELKWRAELREKEAARMSVLEGEWRRRERVRETEVAAMKAEYAALEERTRQVLVQAEERERKLVGAEEAMARRRKDMEREHTSRMAEAEAAVRRLQVECEHQLEIERDRGAELARQRSALEERLAVSEARFAALEQAFAGYREQVRGTSEAALQRELLEVKEGARRAEERAARALRAKAAYKEQVVKLAEQLAGLLRAKQADEADAMGRMRVALDSAALRMAGEEQARYSASQAGELAALRQQLAALKSAALAGISPTKGNSPPGSAAKRPPAGDARPAPDQLQQQVRPPPSSGPTPARPSEPAGTAAGAGAGLAGAGVAAPTPSQAWELHRVGVEAASTGAVPPAFTPTKSRPSTTTPTTTSSTATTVSGGEASTYAQEQQGQGGGEGGAGLGGPTPGPGAGAAALPGAGPAQPTVVHVAEPALSEVRRLLLRRSELLATGAYAKGDPLITKIEARVAALAGLPTGSLDGAVLG